MTDISNREDILDVRDIIDRVEGLEGSVDEAHPDDAEEVREELEALADLLDEMKGYGGDHEWRGDWYPVTLIRDSYFQDHAEELADDIGAINREASWPHNCIDWARAARELQQDYTAVEFDGVTYWYR